ncbi:MAG: alanine--tRNA ligase [Clostridia bacterium]|nr:alanine--tRNA ligase [Clostridia bacterium]
MNKLTSKQLRDAWIKFYEERGHLNIGAVSLIGDGTTGVMFNVAGMQPLMPYLLGKKHPSGKTRLTYIQGCVRTVDIDEVGDSSHCTFFEMMGNWSLGDYFKEEKTKWSFDFLTNVLGFDKNKIVTSVFAGNEDAPRDEETANLLQKCGILPENIYFLGKKANGKENNWWELEGTTGTPCGPDNEWFYPSTKEKCSPNCGPDCDCGAYVEIGNDVYMQYEKTKEGYIPLKNKNVDTGFGFDRLLMFINGYTDVYQTDLFSGAISVLENTSNIKYGEDEKTTRAMRIIADHTRTAVMLIGDKDGIVPSNTGAGYILRRLIRRAIRLVRVLNISSDVILDVAKVFIEKVYNEAYPLLVKNEEYITSELDKEIKKFEATLNSGLKEFEKTINGIHRKNEFMKSKDASYKEESEIAGKVAFRLYDTFGFPLEITEELAKENGFTVDKDGFEKAFLEHQEKSKAVSKGEFKSGLADDNEMTIMYHTATHLLNSALKKVIGPSSHQMGSNITSERLRFDFPCDHKLEESEIKKLEEIVNGWIKEEIPVTREEMKKEDAAAAGAEHQFLDRYPDIVSVYTIGNASKEICTGPHVENTNKLGHFKIIKEESCGSGIRRIKAILE